MSEMKLEGNPIGIITTKLIKDVPRIEKSDSQLRRRVEIKKIVEEPLISACETLYDANIRTWRSSANANDIQYGQGVITVDFSTLSERNKTIARELVREGKASMFSPENLSLKIPLHESSSVEEISTEALTVVRRFFKQRMTWATRYSLEQMRKEPQFAKHNPDEIARATHLYYDPETQTFFLNREQCRKTKEIVEGDNR